MMVKHFRSELKPFFNSLWAFLLQANRQAALAYVNWKKVVSIQGKVSEVYSSDLVMLGNKSGTD